MNLANAPIAGDGSEGLEDSNECLFCGSQSISAEIAQVGDFFFQADPGEFGFARCASCRSLWLRQRPVGERLLAAYSRYYTHDEPVDRARMSGVKGRLRSAYVETRFAAAPTLTSRALAGALRLTGRDTSNIDEYYRFAPRAPARILDYGCGNGAYLLRMQPLGHELYGAEYDPQLLDDLTKRGIVMEDVAAIDDSRWDREFDHITLAHVLEHVPDPDALLDRLLRWLKPDGTLFVEVPNADATGLSIFGRYWRGLEAPRHFSLPSQAALATALQRAGFIIDRQHINPSARRWVWQESLDAAPVEERPAMQAAIGAAPLENVTNAEFLTFVARRTA